MSSRKVALQRIAKAMSVGDMDHVPEWFTEDFTLHDPSPYAALKRGGGPAPLLARLEALIRTQREPSAPRAQPKALPPPSGLPGEQTG